MRASGLNRMEWRGIIRANDAWIIMHRIGDAIAHECSEEADEWGESHPFVIEYRNILLASGVRLQRYRVTVKGTEGAGINVP